MRVPANVLTLTLTLTLFQPTFAKSSEGAVPGGGLEPPQHRCHWCLRPARLPIPPSGQNYITCKNQIPNFRRTFRISLRDGGIGLPCRLAPRCPDITCRDLPLGPAIRAKYVLPVSGLALSAECAIRRRRLTGPELHYSGVQIYNFTFAFYFRLFSLLRSSSSTFLNSVGWLSA